MYSATNSYRFGFNGKENDNEVKGEGNQQDYGMRIYDPRLGRFLSVDPIKAKFPMLTAYQFASNRPIDGIDLDGLEFFKKDNTNYEIDYKPVFSASSVLESVENSAHNALAFTWNVSLGALLETSKEINNHFAGGYMESTPNFIASFDLWQQSIVKYHTETSIDQQAKDVLNDASCLDNYEVIPQIYIGNKIPGLRGPADDLVKKEEILSSKAKVFDRGGSVGIMEGKGELNVNITTKRLTGQMTINDKTVFFEGQVSVENGILNLKDVGIRPAGGTYNTTNLINEIGAEPFRKLIDELTEMRKAAGYTEGKLEFFRLRPEGSKLPDTEIREISF